MAKKVQEIPQRQTQESSKVEGIRFGQLVQGDGERNFAIRDRKKYGDENIESLARSIASEGLKVPFQAYKTEKTVTIAGRELPVFIVIDGHRRLYAIKWLIAANSGHFSDESEVPVQVITGASLADMTVASLSLNRQREPFTDPEILNGVNRCKELMIDDSRATIALEVSATQFRRYKMIAECSWMCEAVKTECIKMTHAAKVLEAAKEVGRIDACDAPFTEWVKQTKLKIETQKVAWEKAKKKLPESKGLVKNYLTPEILEGWVSVIKSSDEQIVFTDDAGNFTYGFLLVDGKLTLPKLECDLSKVPSDILRNYGAEFTRLRSLFMGEYVKKQKSEMLTPSEDELAAAARELDEAVRITEEAEMGRPPTIPLSAPTEPEIDRDLAEEVERELAKAATSEDDLDVDEE
jgi:hypothetical protein